MRITLCRRVRTLISTVLLAFCYSLDTAPADLSNGLVAFYPFSGNAEDASPNRNHLSVFGATLTSDRFGNAASAYSLNGQSDFLLGSDGALPSGNAPRTASMWIKVRSLAQAAPVVVSYGSLPSASTFYLVHLQHTAGHPLAIGKSGGGDQPRWSEPALDKWYHVVMTFDGSQASLFVDAVKTGSAARTYDTAITGKFYVGAYIDGKGNFDGVIDDLRFYNHALSEAEVRDLYLFESAPPGNAGPARLAFFGAINPGDYGLSDSEFGDRVAVEGSRVALHQKVEQGLVHVFERATTGAYKKLATINPPDRVYDHVSFGESVGLAGDTLFVGCPSTFRGGAHDGTGYLFRRIDAGYELKEKWTEIPSQWAGYFTRISALVGDTLAASQGNSPMWGSRGGLFVYRLSPSGERSLVLSIMDDVSRGIAGIALTSETCYVAWGADTASELMAYNLERNSAGELITASKQAAIKTPRPGVWDTISAAEGWVALSNPNDTQSGTDAGAVYLYKHEGESFRLVNTIGAPNLTPKARFGSSVLLLKEGLLLVGAPGETTEGGPLAGAVYLFRVSRDGSVLLQERFVPQEALVGNEEQFGSNMSSDGTTIAITSSGTVGYGAPGAAYLYRLTGEKPEITASQTNITRVVGEPLTLATDVQGFPEPKLQWLRDGSAVPGANGATLQLANLAPDAGGLYELQAWNEFGTSQVQVASIRLRASVSVKVESSQGLIIQEPAGNLFELGSWITFSAVPTQKFMFSRWNGSLASAQNPLTIQVKDNIAVEAVFTPLWNIVLTAGAGGDVILEPRGTSFPDQTRLTLTALPTPGYLFRSWSGDITDRRNPADIILTKDTSAKALFDRIVNVSVSHGEGGVAVIEPFKSVYVEGESITISARADVGYRFEKWLGSLSGSSATITLPLSGDLNAEATFKRLLKLQVVQIGEGTVTGPAAFVEPGETVSVSAFAADGWAFTEWQGAATGSQNPVSLEMTADAQLTAVFRRFFTIQTAVSGSGSVLLNPVTNALVDGTVVQVTATPHPHSRFVRWEGALAGAQPQTDLTVRSNMLLRAVFEPIHKLSVSRATQDLKEGFLFAIEGELGVRYQVETSAGLQAWTPLEIVVLETTPGEYLDRQAPALTRRYYRIRPLD